MSVKGRSQNRALCQSANTHQKPLLNLFVMMKEGEGNRVPTGHTDQKETTSLLIKYFNMIVKFHLWRHSL